jgi:hypothetical protein
MVWDLVSMAAAATERCRVWPKTAVQVVKCVRAHCRGAGSSLHPAIFPVVFGELVASHEPTKIAHSSDISRTVNLQLLRMTVLTLATISSFLDVDGRRERRSLSKEVLPSLNGRNQSNTCVRPTASSPNACCNNCYFSVELCRLWGMYLHASQSTSFSFKEFETPAGSNWGGHYQILLIQTSVLDDGRKHRPKHVELTWNDKLISIVHLVSYFRSCFTLHGFTNVKFANYGHPHFIQFELNYSLDCRLFIPCIFVYILQWNYQRMQLFILCIYFLLSLPYMFRALISPSSGISQTVFLYTTIRFM